MRENLTYGSRWQGMETRISYPRRHPLTLPADLLIVTRFEAGFVFAALRFKFGLTAKPAGG